MSKPFKTPRLECQRKKGVKGHKTTRGTPELYDEKKQQFNVTLTPKALETLHQIAIRIGESRSQVIEKALRGDIKLSTLIQELGL